MGFVRTCCRRAMISPTTTPRAIDRMVISRVVTAPLMKTGDTTYWRISSGASIIEASSDQRCRTALTALDPNNSPKRPRAEGSDRPGLCHILQIIAQVQQRQIAAGRTDNGGADGRARGQLSRDADLRCSG